MAYRSNTIGITLTSATLRDRGFHFFLVLFWGMVTKPFSRSQVQHVIAPIPDLVDEVSLKTNLTPMYGVKFDIKTIWERRESGTGAERIVCCFLRKLVPSITGTYRNLQKREGVAFIFPADGSWIQCKVKLKVVKEIKASLKIVI